MVKRKARASIPDVCRQAHHFVWQPLVNHMQQPGKQQGVMFK